jgi:HSP20 family protein
MAKNEIQVNRSGERGALSRNSFNDMNRLMDSFFGDPFGSLFPELPSVVRRTDVKETDDAYVLFAEIPGIPKEEVEINVNGNILNVRAEHKVEEGGEADERGYRREFRSFNQSFALPSTVDASAIEAHCDHGVLEVFLPKMKTAQSKRVEVQSGKGGFWNRLMGKKDAGDGAKKPGKH